MQKIAIALLISSTSAISSQNLHHSPYGGIYSAPNGDLWSWKHYTADAYSRVNLGFRPAAVHNVSENNFIIDSAGYVWGWKDAESSDSLFALTTTPQKLMGPGIKSISIDFRNVLAIDAAGKIWQWQSGAELFTPQTWKAPVALARSGWQSACAGQHEYYALDSSGILFHSNDSTAWTQVSGTWSELVCSPTFGNARALGKNGEYDLIYRADSVVHVAKGPFAKLGKGEAHTLLDSLGRPWVISPSAYNFEAVESKVTISGDSIFRLDAQGWTEISGSYSPGGFGVNAQGQLWSWGMWRQAYLGMQSDSMRNSFFQPLGGQWKSPIAACLPGAFATRHNGEQVMWGAMTPHLNYDSLHYIPAAQALVEISPTRNGAIALDSNGHLWSWGRSYYGENLIAKDSFEIMKIRLAVKWNAIAASSFQSAAIKDDGSLWAWGMLNTTYGLDTSTTPMLVSAGPWVKVGSNMRGGLGIQADSSLWAWKIDRDTARNRIVTLKQIGLGHRWVQISSNDYASLVLDSKGEIWGIGNNENGQLGTGDSLNRDTLSFVARGSWKKMAIGNSFSAALDGQDSLWYWGRSPVGGDMPYHGDTTFSPRKLHLWTWSDISASLSGLSAIRKDSALINIGAGYSPMGPWAKYPTRVYLAGLPGLAITADSNQTTPLVGPVALWIADPSAQGIVINSPFPLDLRAFNSRGQVVFEQKLAAQKGILPWAAIPSGAMWVSLSRASQRVVLRVPVR